MTALSPAYLRELLARMDAGTYLPPAGVSLEAQRAFCLELLEPAVPGALTPLPLVPHD